MLWKLAVIQSFKVHAFSIWISNQFTNEIEITVSTNNFYVMSIIIIFMKTSFSVLYTVHNVHVHAFKFRQRFLNKC